MQISHMMDTVDLHAAGWPLRLLRAPIGGSTGEELQEEARRLWENKRSVVRWLQREPRGHAAMRVAMLDAGRTDLAKLIVWDSEGPCRGDALDVLCALTAIAELGWEHEIPAAVATFGHVYRTARTQAGQDGLAKSGISLQGEPAECEELGARLQCAGRTFEVDLAACGCGYIVVDAAETGVPLSLASLKELHELASSLLAAYRGSFAADAPGRRVVLTDRLRQPEAAWRMAVFTEDGRLMRAPEGGAIGAALAVLYLKGEILRGREAIVQSLAGGWLRASLQDTSILRDDRQMDWTLQGRAFVTGSQRFLVDPADPLVDGFLLR
jgi:proline racemase